MRKIIILTFVSLDGVMQAPGNPTEDISGDFKYGGWTVTYFDEFGGQVMAEQMGHPFDLLLGRKTYDIFASYWPNQDKQNPIAASLNKATKYVVSHNSIKLEWSNSILIKDNIVSFGVLLDTIIVRSLLVPAISFDIAKQLWWPSKI